MVIIFDIVMELDCFSQQDFQNRTKRNVSDNELSCCYHRHTIHKSAQSNNNLQSPTPKHRRKDSAPGLVFFSFFRSPALKTPELWSNQFDCLFEMHSHGLLVTCFKTIVKQLQVSDHINFWQLYSAKLVKVHLYNTHIL